MSASTHASLHRHAALQEAGAPSIVAGMPTRALRSEAAEWKKRSLGSLRELLGALKGAKKDVDKILGGTKSAVAQICREADRIAKGYDGALDDGDDDYETDSDAMNAMQELPNVDEEAEDAKAQVADTLEALITHLESIKEAVGEVSP